MTELSPQKEIQLKAKILVIDMNTSGGAYFRIVEKLFGKKGESVSDFPEVLVTHVDAPIGFTSGSLEQSKRTKLNLPESVDEISGVVITGSPFTAALLKRDYGNLNVYHKEGKGVFMPYWQKELASFIKVAHNKEKPILGVCFGAEMLSETLGGKVERLQNKNSKLVEKGWSVVWKTANDQLTEGLPETFIVPQNHMYGISRLPDGAKILAENQFGVQMFRINNSWGIQFHPEKTVEQVRNYLSDLKTVKQLELQGVNIEEMRALEEKYSPKVMETILQNFTKIVFKNSQ